eukprot:1206425-Lingulodinium_polyedra.AAC.1
MARPWISQRRHWLRLSFDRRRAARRLRIRVYLVRICAAHRAYLVRICAAQQREQAAPEQLHQMRLR